MAQGRPPTDRRAISLLIQSIDAYSASRAGDRAGGRRPGVDVSSRQLRIVITLARHRSFVEAAGALGVSQPALSRAVQRLERTPRLPLFPRPTPVPALHP